jgi:tetratricopeptide (TPR) repeat protein
MREHFTAQGLRPEDVERLAQGVAGDLLQRAREAQRAGDADPTALAQRLEAERETDASRPARVLRAPEGLGQLEAAWHQVFPCRKPMSTAPFPEDGNDPWLEQTRNDWIAFLQRRPEAADSLDILDDVVMALLPLEASFPQGARDGLAARLVERAQRIVEQAVGDEAIELPWGVPHNRAALRLLARGIELRAEHGEHDQAVALVERMLRLNPKDNHGFRALLMTHRLRVGDLAGTQDLLERYPDDAAVELRYGEVLLRLKQGDPDAARAALAIAHKCNPHVPAALLREDAKPPRGEGAWVAWGSPEEAWEYREEAGELWLAVPGALEWLAENARALPGKARRTPGPRRGRGKGKRHHKRRS